MVWVRKLVLLKTIDPWDEIRQIDFTTGLNIIQGESNESDEQFQSGHGIGKTTVCRLIRYCLGEETFGQPHVVEEVKSNFPDGYVGAEIMLVGTVWAVLLPFRKLLKKYALEGVSLDTLRSAEGTKRYEDFIEKLSTTVLVDVPTQETLTGGQPLVWLHVLAMCSRDQEARYNRYWNWREKRSDSRTPAFKKPKVDAGLCVKAILGLLDANEVQHRSMLDELEYTLNDLRETIRKEKERPEAIIIGLRRRLETEFAVTDASNAPLDTLIGLDLAVSTRIDELNAQIGAINEQLASLNRQIPLMAASLLGPEEASEAFESARAGTAAGTQPLLKELEELRRIRQMIRDAENARCRYGNVRIGDCSYVLDRSEQLNNAIREQQRTTLPVVAEREQAEARLSAQAQRQRELVIRIQQQIDDLGRQRDDLVEERSHLQLQLKMIPALHIEIREWSDIHSGRTPNTTIQQLEQQSADAEKKQTSTKKTLDALIVDQQKRVADFAQRFNSLVQRTLTQQYRGVVEIEEEDVGFRILHGVSVSGEAIETLAILLADLAMLFESQTEHSHHPGLLIHDSPREADLNDGIYRKMLSMAESHIQSCQQNGDAPFQYIVTTTTHPSKPLQKKSITKLELGEGERSLFKIRLEKKSPRSLFDKEANE